MPRYLKRKRDPAIDPAGLLKLLEGTEDTSPGDVLNKVKILANAAANAAQDNVESIPASSITEMDRLLMHLPEIVNTYPETIWMTEDVTNERKPYHPELMASFNLIRNSSHWWGWMRCEAMCRTPVDLILIDRIAAHNEHNPKKKLYIEGEQSIVTLCSPDAPKKIISGIADYVLGYKDKHSTLNICNSFVAIDAKRTGTLESAVPQCSAYMVGIQQQRQQVDKSIQVVYGAVTNGIEWVFIRLDSKQHLSRSVNISMLLNRSHIFSFLDGILYAAACSSPTTTQLKIAAGQPMRFTDHSDFSAVVEEPPFKDFKTLPEEWQNLLVEIDDENDEEDVFR